MPARRVVAGRRAARSAFMALAFGWLTLVLVLVPGPDRAHAQERARSANTSDVTSTIVHYGMPAADLPPVLNTPTSTATVSPTVDPIATATPGAATATSTTKASATATDTALPSDNGSVGPQPTKVVFTQPTVGASDGGSGLAGFSSSDLGSNGLFIFTALGCVMGLLGLVAVLVTWTMLASDGWGPVVKVLLLGNRHGTRRVGPALPAARGGERAGKNAPAAMTRGRGGWR